MFKSVFEKKWLNWILSHRINWGVVFIACGMGCAHTQKNFSRRWDRELHRSKEPMHCSAKGKLEAKQGDSSLHAHFQMYFDWNEKKSKLELQLLNPFRMPVAEIRLSPTQQIFRDDDGERPLSKEPLFAIWFREQWPEEIAFLMGQISSDTHRQILHTESQDRFLMTGEGRTLECLFENQSNAYPSECVIKTETSRAKLIFAFSECRSSL